MEIPKHVEYVLTILEAAGHAAWCVGGCVRDALLGRTPLLCGMREQGFRHIP